MRVRATAGAVALLAVGAPPASGAVFADPTPNRGLAQGLADEPPRKWDVYPMTIAAAGLEGTITKVAVRVDDWYQGDTSYTDVLLQSPAGTFVKLASDAGTYSIPLMTQAADHVNVVFDEDGLEPVPGNGSGGVGKPFGPKGSTVYLRPADYDRYPDVFPDLPPSTATAPASLTVLNGGPANGVWRLYLDFAYAGGAAQMASIAGWSLDIQTTGPPPTGTPGTPPRPGSPGAPPRPGSPGTAPGSGGGSAPGTSPGSTDTTAPVVSRVSVDDERFRAARRGGSVGASGATIGFRLSEAATVSFDLDRLVAGRRVGARCRSAPATRGRGPRCTRVVAVPGAFGYAARTGDTVLRFTGRLNGRALRPGRYRLTGVAIDAAGNRSRPFTLRVTVLPRS